MKRVHSVDIVRGIVMIVMTLDHTRDLLHVTSVSDSPTNLQTTTAALFFTRWITHFCAPTFVFLSGVSTYLSMLRTNDMALTRRFLIGRGVLLVILEFTLVNFGVWFDVHFSVFLFDVIAAIGVGMIVLGLMLRLQAKTILTIGAGIVCLHNLPGSKIPTMLLTPGALPFGDGRLFIMAYPPLPWLGVMLVGFAAGRLFHLPAQQRKSLFAKIGYALLLAFVVVRALNVYGDSVPWAPQRNLLFTLLSFLNVTKYPPSLVFCLLTLGGTFLMLSWVERFHNRYMAIATVYGKVPLFYFIIHWYVLHPLMFLVIALQGYTANDMVFGTSLGRPKGPSGLGLWYIYGIWMGVVVLLYPVCKWFGSYKQRNRDKKWLRYL